MCNKFSNYDFKKKVKQKQNKKNPKKTLQETRRKRDKVHNSVLDFGIIRVKFHSKIFRLTTVNNNCQHPWPFNQRFSFGWTVE